MMPTDDSNASNALARFIAARLDGSAPIATVFWRDMLAHGTLLTFASTMAALLLFANDASPVLATAVFLLPLPYSIFITLAVWRSSAGVPEPRRTTVRIVAAIWLLLSTIL